MFPSLSTVGWSRDLKQRGNVRENPDGSLLSRSLFPAHIVEAKEGTLFDTVLTYYPSNEYAPDPLTWSNRRVVRTPTDVVQDAKPTKTTHLFSSSSIEHPKRIQPDRWGPSLSKAPFGS